MNCHDPIALLVLLARYLLVLLNTMNVDATWQAMYSVASRCVDGPLG